MGVSKETISKLLIGNRFHVKLRILSPYSNRTNVPSKMRNCAPPPDHLSSEGISFSRTCSIPNLILYILHIAPLKTFRWLRVCMVVQFYAHKKKNAKGNTA